MTADVKVDPKESSIDEYLSVLERSIISSLLKKQEMLCLCGELKAEHFLDSYNARIYEIINKLFQNGQSFDLLTLRRYFLENEGDQDIFKYIISIADEPYVGVKSFESHISQLISLSNRKRFGELLGSFENEIKEHSIDVDAKEIISNIVGRIVEFTSKQSSSGSIGLIEGIGQYLEEINEEIISGGSRIIPTGYFPLDSLLEGFRPGQLIVLGARPAMGKTSLALNIAIKAARKMLINNNDREVVFHSFEMSNFELLERSITILRGQPLSRDLQTKRNEIASFIGKIEHLPLSFSFAANRTIDSICFDARLRASKGKLAAVFIDYLQLVEVTTKHSTRTLEVGEISRKLKALALDLDIPVFALAQVSRALENRSDKRPGLHDLRESGNIEQDADVVMFLHREEYYLDRNAAAYDDHNEWLEQKDSFKNKAEIIISKNRRGPTGAVVLKYLDHICKFDEF